VTNESTSTSKLEDIFSGELISFTDHDVTYYDSDTAGKYADIKITSKSRWTMTLRASSLGSTQPRVEVINSNTTEGQNNVTIQSQKGSDCSKHFFYEQIYIAQSHALVISSLLGVERQLPIKNLATQFL
jgi:hypothetical protein